MNVLEKIKKQFPCRDKIINELYNLIGNPNDCYPDCLFVCGDMSTGKTSILRKLLANSGSKYVFVDLIECYMSKILFEYILNGLKYTKAERTENHDKCDNMGDLIWEMKRFKTEFSFIICIDNAEKLRDMDANILPALVRLQELTGLNVCCVLISQIPLEKYYSKTGLSEVLTINFPQYSKTETHKILLNDFGTIKAYMGYKLKDGEKNDLVHRFLNSLDESFYDNYLNAFLSVFYINCRDLTELKLVSRNVFEIYCSPVLKEEINRNDVTKLWRHIAVPLKVALAAVYTRTVPSVDAPDKESLSQNVEMKNYVKSVELPYYAKYLLIAAFLASHNAAKDDKKLFVKNSSKQKKRLQTINAHAKVSEKMSTSLGPKSFSIDRLLAIFYAIIEEKVGLTCNLLAQISTLVQLKFLTYVSGENNIMDGSARLQCVVGLDFISQLGKIVGFNVKQYLSDFM